MKLKVNEKEYEVREPSRAEKRKIATVYGSVFNLRTRNYDHEATERVVGLIETVVIQDESHPVYDQAPLAVVDDLREIARLISEGLTGEELPG